MADRNIYNNSGATWTFESVAEHLSKVGNVWFSGSGSGNAQNGPWALPPNSSVAIQYTTDGGFIQGFWKITDNQNQTQEFRYNNDQFPLPPSGQAPVIQHRGNTGAASLNDPADGDISIGADHW